VRGRGGKSKGGLFSQGRGAKLGGPLLSLRPVDEAYLYISTYNLCTPFPTLQVVLAVHSIGLLSIVLYRLCISCASWLNTGYASCTYLCIEAMQAMFACADGLCRLCIPMPPFVWEARQAMLACASFCMEGYVGYALLRWLAAQAMHSCAFLVY
jgi:hypothetical protein